METLLTILKKNPKKRKTNDDDETEAMEQLKALFKPPENTDKDKNHIYLYSDINVHTCLDLNRKLKELEKDLLKHAIDYNINPPNIYLHINSPGGCLFSAFGTVDMIVNSKVPVISIIEGNAASAATIISMVCHKRYATANSLMLIHQLTSGVYGNYHEIKDNYLNDTEIMNQLYDLYSKYTTMNLETIKKVLKHDRYWNVTKCKEFGLIDEVWNGSHTNITLDKPVMNVVNLAVAQSEDNFEIINESPKSKPKKVKRQRKSRLSEMSNGLG